MGSYQQAFLRKDPLRRASRAQQRIDLCLQKTNKTAKPKNLNEASQ